MKFLIFLIIVAFLGAAGFPHQPDPMVTAPGFWKGFLHGFLLVYSLLGSIFWDIRIYQFPNNGGWYDFGFVTGVTGIIAVGRLMSGTK